MPFRPVPNWLSSIGLAHVDPPQHSSVGPELTWSLATPSSPNLQVHYNIYYDYTRYGVFPNGPKLITTVNDVIVPLAEAGSLTYFAVRAAEFDPTLIDITQLVQVGLNLYQYPDHLLLLNPIDAYGDTLNVSSTSGYPSQGFLLVDYEIMYYTVMDATSFTVTALQRGQNLTEPVPHAVGAPIQLWYGNEEGNSRIAIGIRDWSEDEYNQVSDAYFGLPDVDQDGYRAKLVDTLTISTEADAANANFPPADLCGWHSSSIYDVLSGSGCTATYGNVNGFRGINAQDVINSRLSELLTGTGEPLILLRRKWTGKKCYCMHLQTDYPRDRCPSCLGVGFINGYMQFVNQQTISQAFVNTQGYIMARVSPYVDDLALAGNLGLNQIDQLTAWTLASPTIKDRDVIIRFNEDFTQEFRYEVLNVTRNKTLFGNTGTQTFIMKRLDKSDMVYTYNYLNPPETFTFPLVNDP